jgi:hypothetical protein
MSDFDRAAPWLEAALKANDKRPLWTLEAVKAEIDSGNAYLWMFPNCCFVTTITPPYSNGERVIDAWLGGGDMNEMLQKTPELEAWGRSVGCTQAHVMGREGWTRALAPLGYERYCTTVRKML